MSTPPSAATQAVAFTVAIVLVTCNLMQDENTISIGKADVDPFYRVSPRLLIEQIAAFNVGREQLISLSKQIDISSSASTVY
jgi:hypothetical protein